ncbi:Glycoside hydrolase superfamily [Elaphomyces granulatus]
MALYRKGFSLCQMLLSFCCLLAPVVALELTVSTTGGNHSNPYLYGFMFEDINHSGDGGIHSQLLQNNGFQGSNPNLTAYAAVGNVDLTLDTVNPLSTALPLSLRVAVPAGASGAVGFSNSGYWGIPVNADSYVSAFYIKGDYVGEVTVRLVGASSGTAYATDVFNVTSNSTQFTYIETKFQSAQAPDGNNIWTLTFDASKVAGSALYFSLIQLYPPTFQGRTNGLKPSIANVLQDMKASFLRFPGGNNLEGNTASSRWKWNETVGPLYTRPGRQGIYRTETVVFLWLIREQGLNEYFQWTKDMDLVAVLGAWDGLSLAQSGNVITGDALKPYIQDVLNELEYILGDASTTYGKLRASHGYPNPWSLTYVEIGNEDQWWYGGPSYAERFTAFHDAIKSKYPNLVIIASTDEYFPVQKPEGIWMDYHSYGPAEKFINEFNKFDNVDRKFPYVVTEYACVSVDGADLQQPTMQASVAEAIFMIGMERNSDVVQMAAYAPLLQNYGGYTWKNHEPNLVIFNNDPNGVFLTTSYYVQQMFAANRGDTILPVQSDGPFGPVYYVASKASSKYYVKLANYGSSTQQIQVKIEGTNSGLLTVLSGNGGAANTFGSTPVLPRTTPVVPTLGAFDIVLPGWTVAVLAAQ